MFEETVFSQNARGEEKGGGGSKSPKIIYYRQFKSCQRQPNSKGLTSKFIWMIRVKIDKRFSLVNIRLWLTSK